MDTKIKISLEFAVTGNGLEDAMAEYDELTVEGLIREILDKSIACDQSSARDPRTQRPPGGLSSIRS